VITASVTNLFPSPEPQPTRFEEVWKLWPNKAKKPLARAKYLAALAGFKTRTFDRDSNSYVELELKATEEDIFAGVKAYVSSQITKDFKLKDDGKYVPMLSTFLNGGRWLDLL